MFKARLKLTLQNLAIFGGLFIAIYYASQFTYISVLYTALAVLVSALGSLSLVYKRKETYHMVYTEEASEEDKQEGTTYTEPRPSYFKGFINYFVYGFSAVYSITAITLFNFTLFFTLIILVSLPFMLFTRYNLEKHTPIMIFEDSTIQFLTFLGLALLLRGTQINTLGTVSISLCIVGTSIVTLMLLYRYHTITHYKYKKTNKLPKNSTTLVGIYGVVLSISLILIGVAVNQPFFFIGTGVFTIVLLAVLLLFNSTNLPSVRDII